MLSDKKISIIVTLRFDVIERQVMALSLERIIWYDFSGFLHIEIFVEEPVFLAKKLHDECWEEVERQLCDCRALSSSLGEAKNYH